MSTVAKSVNHATNNCTNGIANMCCPPQQNGVSKPTPLMEQQNNVPKKIVKVIDPPKSIANGIVGKGHLKSPPISIDSSIDLLSADNSPKIKVIDDEKYPQGIKLTDVALPHISVQTLECKKTDKPQTTIIIYKPKNSNRAPTAKVIVTKVFQSFIFLSCVPNVFFRLLLISSCV